MYLKISWDEARNVEPKVRLHSEHIKGSVRNKVAHIMSLCDGGLGGEIPNLSQKKWKMRNFSAK